MSLEDRYIETQFSLLGITLALAGEAPKRSGDFETTYKSESGKEVAVKRSPDGKFANKNGGASAQKSTVATASAGESFGKAIGGFADEIAKMPAKVQEVVRKAIFDSELSRAIDKGAEKIIKSAYDPSLAIGFELGQSIKDELAKKPFSKFAETITSKFEEFRKSLPQKSEDLKKEIIRIAKDPNTSSTIAAGAVMGLAAYFHITGLFKLLRAGGIAYGLLKIPKNAAVEIEKEFAQKAAALLPELSEQDALKSVAGMGQQAVKALKLAGAIDIGLHFIGASFNNIVSSVLTSQAGRIIMDRAKTNEQVENDRLKQEISTKKKEDSDALYQQQLDRQAKDAKAQQSLIKELQKDAPKTPEEIITPDGTLAAPVFTVNLSDEDEAYVADPKNYEAVMTEAYKDEEFLKLGFTYTEAQALEVLAVFTGSQSEADKFHEIGEQATEAMKNRLTVVIKEEIKRQRAIARP
jgi:hypothetical protein